MIRFKSSELWAKNVCIDQLEKLVKQVSFTDQIPPDIWSVDCGVFGGFFHINA